MADTEPESEFEREEEDAAAAEAAAIGGRPSETEPLDEDDPELDPAQRPLVEAGEGEAEGFELSERALIEHASHGDQHSAGRVLEDAIDVPDDRRAAIDGEADSEHSEDG